MDSFEVLPFDIPKPLSVSKEAPNMYSLFIVVALTHHLPLPEELALSFINYTL